MPLIPSSFRAPRFLANGHLQTILPVLLRRRARIDFRRERMELPDGDFLDLDWSQTGSDRVAILSHGLEGASDAGYIRGTGAALTAAGWDVLAWNFRGCGREMNRLPRFYHSGETGDLAAVVAQAASQYPRIALVGFSLGGNLTLKYLGEAAPHPAVVCAAAVSVPVDLASSAKALDQRRGNRIYLTRFLKTLIAKVETKARHFPDALDARGARRIRTFQEFDDRYTAPLHGFRDAAEYWSRSSARQYLSGISIPTLILNARNDPFLTPESFPVPEAAASAFVHLETPESGGHVGFLDLRDGVRPWHERRIVEFFRQHTEIGGRFPAPPSCAKVE